MLDKKWKHLKSGTDIRGVAIDGYENENCELTDEVVEKIANAFAKWLADKKDTINLSVAIGHDSRISAQRIKNVLIKSLTGVGINVYDCGYCSTPSMFMATISDIKVDASIEITASHHPYHRNGLKFFTCDGGLEGSDIEEILMLAQNENFLNFSQTGTVTTYDFMEHYCKFLRDMICSQVNSENYDQPLEGLKIIVDAGNGVGGFYVNNVLKPLGANCDGSQFLEPDGMFPNHIPNPENKQAIDSACVATVKANADLGIIFDTDVDRMGCVDAKGDEINRNKLIALASVIALEGNEGGTIVTDSVTSSGLREFIENELSAKQLRFKRGYKNVINKSIELNNNGVNSPLAIETSGHAALRENHFLDDGAYLATKIVIKLAQLRKQGKSLEDLIAKLAQPVESYEVRIPINLEDFKDYGLNVLNSIRDYSLNRDNWNVEKENYEGERVNFETGWFLLRLSVHDPILPLNVESDVSGKSVLILKELYDYLKSFDKLNLSDFEKYI